MSTLPGLLLLSVSLLAATGQPISPSATNTMGVPAGAKVPPFPRVAAFAPDPGNPAVRSSEIEVIHAPAPLGGFLVRVAGHTVAVGAAPMLVGYVHDGQMHWMDCSAGPIRNGSVAGGSNEIAASYECADNDGATWRVSRHFRPQGQSGAIEVQTEISIDKDRAIAFLPLLMLFPGVGSFGPDKGQGLLPGLEYLENEPSSSEADVIGPAAKRQVPNSLKITFPLMALQADDRYIALTWQMRPYLSALFDSPDRLFGSGGHVMGLLFPGSNGNDRDEGNLLPRVAEMVRSGNTIRMRATIFGGPGRSVVPAIQHFCRLRPLPPLPPAPEPAAYVSQAAEGWLDSKIREGNLFRHALAGGGFPPQPAADAALWMEWLADREPQPPEASRLRQTITNVLSVIPAADLNSAGVGHVRYPVESLVWGHVPENADHAAQTGRALLASFEPDGSVKYHAKPGAPDFAKTHWTNEASGFTAAVVADLLAAACFSGERDLIDASLERLRAMDRFQNGVPRGAQTWECPLHTPDILGAAHMVKAYTLGYELSGDPHYLEQARYWAWTGLPFVYLVNPTDKPVGLYSTIAVFGATKWRAPVWFGLPVQWCGLVYADALYGLSRHDPKGFWKQVADGITISGIQQSWPEEDAQFKGLLPDSFVLRDQKRNGPAINPATVEALAARYFGQVPVYDFRCFLKHRLLVHAPGQIANPSESAEQVSFQVRTWVDHPYFILLDGISSEPRLKINGKVVPCSAPHQFLPKSGRLILQGQGEISVEIGF